MSRKIKASGRSRSSRSRPRGVRGSRTVRGGYMFYASDMEVNEAIKALQSNAHYSNLFAGVPQLGRQVFNGLSPDKKLILNYFLASTVGPDYGREKAAAALDSISNTFSEVGSRVAAPFRAVGRAYTTNFGSDARAQARIDRAKTYFCAAPEEAKKLLQSRFSTSLTVDEKSLHDGMVRAVQPICGAGYSLLEGSKFVEVPRGLTTRRLR